MVYYVPAVETFFVKLVPQKQDQMALIIFLNVQLVEKALSLFSRFLNLIIFLIISELR